MSRIKRELERQMELNQDPRYNSLEDMDYYYEKYLQEIQYRTDINEIPTEQICQLPRSKTKNALSRFISQLMTSNAVKFIQRIFRLKK